MITIRYAAMVLGTITLVALRFTPRSTASVVLAIFFFICFVVLCWTLGAFTKTTDTSKESS
jgi:hypothetical protein